MLRFGDKSTAVRKQIENHTFEDEEGEEYEASNFGGFKDYFRRKKIKLQNLDAELRSSSSENPRIFRGVVAHVNGYTQPSLNDLHRLVVAYGGGFMQYLDGKTAVTHIIASGLTLKKRVEFRNYRIVKPAWVVESVRAGRLLPWDDFRVVDEGRSQKVLGFDNGRVVSQTTDLQLSYKEQTRDSWYTSQIKEQLNEPPCKGNISSLNSPPIPLDDLRDAPPGGETPPSLDSVSSESEPGLKPPKGERDGQMRSRQQVQQFKTNIHNRREPEDPIVDDIESPRRKTTQRPHPAALTTMPKSLHDASEQKPLNTLGTQFIIPSQVDPSVAAELPEEIRSKITGSHRLTNRSAKFPRASKSPAPAAVSKKAIPASSQLDQETLEALPPEIREEVLSFYRLKTSSSSRTLDQMPVPSSARKGGVALLKMDSKKPAGPTKKNRAGPSVSRGGKGDSNPTLAQTAFIRPGSSNGKDPVSQKLNVDQRNTDDDTDDMDPDFLAALPEDIRLELLEESRRARLKRRANLDLDRNNKNYRPISPVPQLGQRYLRLPPRPPKPTFTAQKLSTLPELREVISSWHEEFRDEGPYEEDVEAFNKHLHRVVCEEGDMAKAVSLVGWLGWVVSNDEDANSDDNNDNNHKKPSTGKGSWKQALGKTEEAVQAAVKERGLGPVVGLGTGIKS
ncbi:hypothetical protein FGG08_002700 [Glutinoglossum americanum]|uniref:BRCT domain-containing protein n=1 Tax=Glutinoglossum americanum TaxID=1670608 RepID=A0A9P8I489_9PEZI|nr:hypothetical protein FGG08_002700 [Glutinoglossum americanum]